MLAVKGAPSRGERYLGEASVVVVVVDVCFFILMWSASIQVCFGCGDCFAHTK